MNKNEAGLVDCQMVGLDGLDFTGTVTVKYIIDGGALTDGNGTVTNKTGGLYQYAALQAETNGDILGFQFSGTGAVTQLRDFDTRPNTEIAAIKANVGNIATVGGTAYSAASSRTLTAYGTETNDYTATHSPNSVYHQLTDSAGTLNFYYGYTLRPDEECTGFLFKGRIMGSNDSIAIQVYDWVSGAFVTQHTLVGTNLNTDTSIAPSLVDRYTGTGANAGIVRVRFYGTGLTTATLYIDQCIIARVSTSKSVGYANGFVWIDTKNGVAGTVLHYNGVADKKSLTWADALNIAGQLNSYLFNISPGSTIAPTANVKEYHLTGSGWFLVLGGYDYSNTAIYYAENITGTATCADHEMFFWNCQTGAITVGEADFHDCHITDTVTLGSTAPMLFDACVGVPIGTPGVDFGSAIGSTKVEMGNCAGVWTIKNLKVGDIFDYSGAGQITFDNSCTGGTATLTGDIVVTNNGSGITIIRGDDPAGITTLLSRVTATRAGYWDNLSNLIPATFASPGVFAMGALVNAPVTTALDAAGVRTAIGLASANLDAQLTGINSNVDAIPTTPLLAANYTAPDNTGIANILAALPANFALLGISAAGKINGVVLVDTATDLTTLPAPATDWLTAAAVSAGAVTKVQTGLALTGQIPARFTNATFASDGVFASGALVNVPTGSSLTVGDIVDGVCDELLSNHTVAGSLAVGISNASAAGNPMESLYLVPGSAPPLYIAYGDLIGQLYVPPQLQPVVPVPSPPLNPNQCRVVFNSKDLTGAVHYGKTITFTLSGFPSTNDDYGLEAEPITLKTDQTGYLTGLLDRTDTTLPPGRTYKVTSNDFGLNLTGVELTTATYNLIGLFTP